jgi:hypothetical protein
VGSWDLQPVSCGVGLDSVSLGPATLDIKRLAFPFKFRLFDRELCFLEDQELTFGREL